MTDNPNEAKRVGDRVIGGISAFAAAAREAGKEFKRRLFEDREREVREAQEREAAARQQSIDEQVARNREAAKAYERYVRHQGENDVELDLHDGRSELAHYTALERQARMRGDEQAAGEARMAATAVRGHLARLEGVLDQKHERVLGEVGIQPETLRAASLQGAIRAEAVDKIQAENGEFERSPARDAVIRVSERTSERLERVVVVESPGEAIAYEQLHRGPGTHFICAGPLATEESRRDLQRHLQAALDRVQQEGRAPGEVRFVVAAGKSREAAAVGREAAAALPSVEWAREMPHGARWVDTVMEQQRDFIRAHRIRHAVDRAPRAAEKGMAR